MAMTRSAIFKSRRLVLTMMPSSCSCLLIDEAIRALIGVSQEPMMSIPMRNSAKTTINRMRIITITMYLEFKTQTPHSHIPNVQ